MECLLLYFNVLRRDIYSYGIALENTTNFTITGNSIINSLVSGTLNIVRSSKGIISNNIFIANNAGATTGAFYC
jgi:hypothetical protein